MKLAEHVTADDLLRDFAVVSDACACMCLAKRGHSHSFSLFLLQVMEDDAEVFILKLWRLLIYETEAKHLGIAKSY